MSDLLDAVLTAHGGAERWQSVSGITARGRVDVAYFAGYASWNYLTSPLLLTRDGITVTEGGPWQEPGETWRRLEVQFPRKFHTPSDSVGGREVGFADRRNPVRDRSWLTTVVSADAFGHDRFGRLAVEQACRLRDNAILARVLVRLAA